MSGIYGMVRYDGAPVTRDTLAPMAAAMSFWGPDGHGQWCGEGAGLGHLMLHVTPESLHERLPASIRVAPHLVISADARIDNREELFDALGAPGTGRDQTPDSSLILLAYERWGADCLKRLLGDFAFAIWDSRERRLFCARDTFGCKPFVYHHDGRRFIFASDVKGVLARVESPRLNEPLLAAYLQMATSYGEKELTFFRNIVKLPAAHAIMVTAGGMHISRYWLPEEAPEVRLAADADYAEQLRFLFRQAVECRMRTAFPMGSHLSGGLDSSAISIVAARYQRTRGRELAVFSWAPPPEAGATPDPGDEHGRIDAVCKQENLSCQYVPATTASYVESFQRDFTVEPTVMLAREGPVQRRAADQRLRVILSGWGGDEAVSGQTNNTLAEFIATGHWSELPGAIRLRLETGTPDSSLRQILRNARRLARSLGEVAILNLPDSLYSLIGTNPYREYRASCIQAAFRRRYREETKELRGPIWRHLPSARATICRLLDMGYTTQRMEHWAGSGARHGLVYRYPMLDRRLVDFILGVPATQYSQTGLRRSLFRRATGDLLPASCNWLPAKKEPQGHAAIRRIYFDAHSQWARHLLSEGPNPRVDAFVSAEKIRRAVETAVPDKLLTLSGVREALCVYSIGHF